MTVDRAHEVRVVVGDTPGGDATVADVRATVREVLGRGWRVQRFLPGRPQFLVTGDSDATVGTAEHARQSHEAALALHRTGRFARVEADVPVPTFDDPVGRAAFADTACGDASKPLDWVHRLVNWPAAMQHMAATTRGGAGIRIGHPDSGYTKHPNLGLAGLDLTTDRDVIDGDDDALDDLTPNPLWPLPNPGHGTSTASVIVGRGTAAKGIVGLAPKAVLVPIRATESVVQLFDSDVAKAVAHARKVRCHVVSMSLGGKGFFGLKGEIEKAVDAGMIVMATAGNRVGVVTAPASYSACLAVAATGPGDRRWPGSSNGSAVDVSMPGECVWRATYKKREPEVSQSEGTSYAVAHLAGAAALWLAHHGHRALVTRYGAKHVQSVFLSVLRWPGVCVVPDDWDPDWGVGRVDLLALLKAPLPAPGGDVDTFVAFGTAADGAVERVAASLGVGPVAVRTRLTAMLGASSPAELDELLAAHEGELVYLALSDDGFADAIRSPGMGDAFAPTVDVAGVTGDLAARLTG